MKFCISFGKLKLKYFLYCVLFIILEIYMYYFIFYKDEKIITEHNLMYSFYFFLGYLLNIIPAWISNIKSKENEISIIFKEIVNEPNEYIYYQPYKEQLSIKNILIFFFICFIPLITDIIDNIRIMMEDNSFAEDKKYDDNYIFIEYLIIFLLPKLGKEVYYKHQNISFSILILVEIIKNIYFFIKKLYHKFNIISIILNIIYSFLYSIYYLYIKGLMKYKFINPAKCNFMIGIINVPLTILIYYIISFTSLGNIKSKYYYDNIFELFKDLGKIEAKSVFILISLPFVFGIYHFIVIKTIYDYTIYHMYIPFLIQYFIENILKNFDFIENIFLISSFFIELMMILIFLEIIEINCCGLNKNLKRNIELRGIIDSSLTIENDDDEIDIERK